MTKQIPIKNIVSTLSDQKGVSEEVVLEVVVAALVTATKKKYGADIEVRIDLDKETGDYNTYRVWTVVADPEVNVPLEFPLKEITLSAAQIDDPNIQVGDTIEDDLESVEFDRIAAQTAKQVIVQKVREAERAQIAAEYESKIGELVLGVVKKTTRDNVIVDLGNNAEALLKKDKILPRENYRPGDKVRAYIYDIETEAKGPQIMLSRGHNNMLLELFKIEVPEVGEGIIQIKAVARDPGVRAKIAVHTNDGRMDPVGACVGMRGARVQAVSNELGGERVDIILWNENIAQFVINAMAPAEIVSIEVDEESETMDLAVKDEYLSLAIGRSGQNIRLASDLTGWKLNVLGESEVKEKSESEIKRITSVFTENLHVDDEVAAVLIEEGFSSLEEIAYIPANELLNIDGFDEEIVTALRDRAKDSLLTTAIAMEEKAREVEDDTSISTLEGMDEQLEQTLAQHDIKTRDDLAELATDDLLAITSMNSEDASKLILAARAHWFDTEESASNNNG